MMKVLFRNVSEFSDDSPVLATILNIPNAYYTHATSATPSKLRGKSEVSLENATESQILKSSLEC